ncbi:MULTISPECIES: TraR/DksA family transcriptional regulator [Rhizobium]|uniref:DnaK suppressor protein n=1 Tax=Rhizobium johnstonii (strain DSM 114642 / LMG 32736 / 3841) TaxID=216596 RepID=Q1MI46_RHIJ3|nr:MULTISPECIES: TraR/DksA family transcriptional regulator [Rhizobium]MBY5343855.1 TraR/DksA family transcriptional regulator [Rhizobium leguminosarum]MBY5378116.1 TraR/DksA family transcriptional regulator [Rhizobium leguminosarum]MBY5389001.1 TraR/DksA family transcriptional regulator [Rhizobium leguminosarum]MBY5420775.1 TraR/DksA family transcriptional regulator [Rhizobium leguminosarum]MBY5429406.1 TraR/DksA family transcriptional regulator [Rhizobium leguminosarum]
MNKSSVQTVLQTMKDDLARRLGAIGADLSVALEKDSEERATQVENDEVLREMQAEGHNQIAAIDAAIGRLNDDTYGKCVKCHNRIGKERLTAVPYTPFCIDCAKSFR